MSKRLIKDIIIHHTASGFGDVDSIRDWHVNGRGWSDVAYHVVILNGYRQKRKFNPYDLGKVQLGRPINQIGAHTMGRNFDTIGIALVGNFMKNHPYPAQLSSLIEFISILIKSNPVFESVITIDQYLREKPSEHIYTHGEIFSKMNKYTSCAGISFPINEVRERISRLIL